MDREQFARDILPPGAGRAETQAGDGTDDGDSLDSVATDLWSEFKEQIFTQVTALEQGVAALLEGRADPEGRKKAQREAHKLAGTLGSLGFPQGTHLAREIEQTLRSEGSVSQSDLLQICDSVVQLRNELERGPANSGEQVTPKAGGPPAVGDDKRSRRLVLDNDREERKKVSCARVLAVDDDPCVLESLQRLLEPQDIKLSTLSDPLGFWDMLEGFSPDLLLLDVDMPHVSGVELCRVLRNDVRWSGIPILFLTACGDLGTLQNVFAAGADDFVTKPFVGPELVARITTRIARTHQLLGMMERDMPSGAASLKTSLWYLERLFRLAIRRQERLCLVVLELDDFEQINTRYGRCTGDRVYRRLGQLLMGTFRTEDVVSRWEGDEFVVGLYGMTRGDGIQRLAELLETLRQEEFTSDSGGKFHVTFSAGVAQDLMDGPDLYSVYHAARAALGRAKKMGGDRVLTSAPALSEGDSPQGRDVVVVDDDETLANLLRHALTTRGYRAECFLDGQSALEKLGGPSPELRPQVLLLDVDLPNMDGLSVLRRLSEDGVVKRTRVIMLTARSSEAEVVNALEWGAFDHVAKPFSLRVLMQRIRRAMEA